MQKKLVQLKKYLPTLQLKKMLLQAEVNNAKEQVLKANRVYKEELLTFETSIKLLSDSSVSMLFDEIEIEEKNIVFDNIAGIEVPCLKSVLFKPAKTSYLYRPFWHGDMVKHLQAAKEAFVSLNICKQKKAILDEELRMVSIRVNLFEKRLIPDTNKSISKIKVFLGDQDLAAVSLSKIAKEKSLKKAMEESYASKDV